MNVSLNGHVAVVTGAARGLGLVLAEDLAREGVNVCGADVRAEPLAYEMNRIATEYAVQTLALSADVGSEPQVRDLVRQVFAKWRRIDILINNAGLRKTGPVHEMSAAQWDEIHAANLKGQFLCSKEVLAQGMLQQNSGTLIFISSDAGKTGNRGSSVYSSSKFGVAGLAQSVARDLKETKIRVTAVFPGRIWTPMAQESEYAHMDLDWLDVHTVSNGILFCIKQDADTIIPEFHILHRAQL